MNYKGIKKQAQRLKFTKNWWPCQKQAMLPLGLEDASSIGRRKLIKKNFIFELEKSTEYFYIARAKHA